MRWIVPLLLCLLGSCVGPARGDPDLSAAVNAARHGNLEPLAKLQLTPADVPELASNLDDQSTTVRGEMVALLEKIGGDSACEALTKPLTDPSADIRERTARALHHKCSPGAEVAASLRQSVAMGNTAAAAVLMLGRFPGAENIDVLKALLNSKQMVKLESWHRPVPQSLAAAVAAASAGYSPARDLLRDASTTIEGAEFLASVLPDIHSATVARQLLALLGDERATALGVPSGAQPQRRICDLAVDGFSKSLKLNTFPLRPGDRYTAEEISKTRQLASEAISRL